MRRLRCAASAYWVFIGCCFLLALVMEGFALSPLAHLREAGSLLNPGRRVIDFHGYDFTFDWLIHVVTIPFLLAGILSLHPRFLRVSWGFLAIAVPLTAVVFFWAMNAPGTPGGTRTVADLIDDFLLYSAFAAVVGHLVLFLFRKSVQGRVSNFKMMLTLGFVLFLQFAIHGTVVLANTGLNQLNQTTFETALSERRIQEILPLCRAAGTVCLTINPLTRQLERTGAQHPVPAPVLQGIKAAIAGYSIVTDDGYNGKVERLRMRGLKQINGSTFMTVYKVKDAGAVLFLVNWREVAVSGYAVHTAILSLSLCYLLIPLGWGMLGRFHGEV